ncbi:hypothetical protein M404DRAFT_506225 [Pisolithus tinctorius Marx 270]|uniref:Uncharacterized protein n=1 Tax=Pisolithus tinctorius Marx 270 TaxID=870435 RepID=A0A0C3JA25_PISTI|nr:hypothetical protein M404DRAFT_506225 [Pisolithus tinctorius Marx 270]
MEVNGSRRTPSSSASDTERGRRSQSSTSNLKDVSALVRRKSTDHHHFREMHAVWMRG